MMTNSKIKKIEGEIKKKQGSNPKEKKIKGLLWNVARASTKTKENKRKEGVKKKKVNRHQTTRN